MTTFDEVITASTVGFMDKARRDGKPFFVWMNPTRAHVLTHLAPAKIIADYLPSFVEFPPMQTGASFSVGDLKEKVEQAQKAAQANQD